MAATEGSDLLEYLAFKVKLVRERIIVERQELAHSIRLEKLFHIKR